jgi:Amiloride-sensitive sodium channel
MLTKTFFSGKRTVLCFPGKPQEEHCRFIVHITFLTYTVPANLGGAFNLCMGMSLLSIFEVFYFILCRWKNHLRRRPLTEPEVVQVAIAPKKNSKLQHFH